MMDPVRLGVIGCGVIGRQHIQYALDADTIELAAVADVREEAAKEAAQRAGVQSVYTSGSELLEDDRVEAVVLAMPTCHRFELATKAFEKGKHVLTEKPVAMSAEDVRRMIAARGDRVAGCCSSRLSFMDSVAATREFISTGALGQVRVVHCRAIRAAGPRSKRARPPWRLSRSLNGGGILVNWGCYDLDYLFSLLDWSLRPTLALARTWPVAPDLSYHAAEGSDAEAHVCALVCCEGGSAISFERAEFATAAAEEAWRIVGSRGSLTLNMMPTKDKKIVYHSSTAEEGLVSKNVWEGDDDSKPAGLALLLDFAGAIREGRQPATSLERSLIIQEMTDAIYESADTGRAVEIKPPQSE